MKSAFSIPLGILRKVMKYIKILILVFILFGSFCLLVFVFVVFSSRFIALTQPRGQD